VTKWKGALRAVQAGQLSNRFSLTHVRVLPEHSVAQRMASMQAALDALAAVVSEQDRLIHANKAEAFSKEEGKTLTQRLLASEQRCQALSEENGKLRSELDDALDSLKSLKTEFDQVQVECEVASTGCTNMREDVDSLKRSVAVLIEGGLPTPKATDEVAEEVKKDEAKLEEAG